MKTRTLKTVIMLNLLLIIAAVSVAAQSPRGKTIQIPFTFTVGDKILPAGNYTVEPYSKDNNNVWLIQRRYTNTTALVTTNPVRANETQEKSTLVFQKIGDQYFLSQIWTGGGNSGRQLRTPNVKNEVAKIERETVVIAAGQ